MRAAAFLRRALSTSSSGGVAPKTAVLMLNMGGPSTPDEETVRNFLQRLFTDNDIIEMGGGVVQNTLGKFIAKRRTPKVAAQYELIGGSPIRKWTEHQGEAMCKLLDAQHPASAPHQPYTAFRYADPLTEETLVQMKADGVKRVVAFSQFPQWSCTTTGSSMNELWRTVKALDMGDDFEWSIIDRWADHPGFIDSVSERIAEGMEQFAPEERSKVTILFSAHSVPMKVVQKGDHYVPEVAATVKAVMNNWRARTRSGTIDGLQQPNKYILAWQSKVGFLPWMAPSTSATIEALGKKGTRHVLVVPVAFTSDHVETLYEVAMEYKEEAEEHGITHFKWTTGLNDSATFASALADIVAEHLDGDELYSSQYKMKCLGCTKPLCRQIMNPAKMDGAGAVCAEQ